MTEVVRHLPAILRPYYLAEAIGVAEAARQSGKSMRTMREWCALHRIGRIIGGRWAISQVALDMCSTATKIAWKPTSRAIGSRSACVPTTRGDRSRFNPNPRFRRLCRSLMRVESTD